MPVADITPALPKTNPGKFICLGLNYVEPVTEGGGNITDYPAMFMPSHNSLMAAGAPVVRPSCSENTNYEAEPLVIIGTRGRHIARADALP